MENLKSRLLKLFSLILFFIFLGSMQGCYSYEDINNGIFVTTIIFDENEKWVVKDFDSKSSNSPFINEELTGKVKYTISEGKIVYTDK